MLWGRSMTEAERERLSRNLAEVIDDLYRQHAPPRDHERLIQLVQVQIRHAMSLAERSARHGSGRDDRYSADHLGQPDLQALVRQCGGFDKISLELWTAWDRANAEWQERRRAGFKTPPTSRRPR